MTDWPTDSDMIVLPSGRKFYANCGIVGIDADGGIAEGFDGDIGDDDWAPEDRVALADLMIERWKAYREKHQP